MIAAQPRERLSAPIPRIPSVHEAAPLVLTAIAFAVLSFYPLTTLVRDWWQASEPGYGLLIAPIALWLAWKRGRHPAARPQPAFGVVILIGAVLLRFASGMATEFFTLRLSVLAALVGLTVFHAGVRQVLHWWLPFLLVFLSIPLPELVTQSVAQPLQFKAAQLGVALLKMRQIPVRLTGSVILLPRQELFVADVCSGLRSLPALFGAAILCIMLFIRTIPARAVLLLIVIPVAMVVNGLRAFLIGFLAVFFDASLGKGFMHGTQGWPVFLVSFAAVAVFIAITAMLERRFVGAMSHA